jgi:hypothetical protein
MPAPPLPIPRAVEQPVDDPLPGVGGLVGEKRGDLIYTKPMLLAIGDAYEEQIAQDRMTDAKFR